MVDFTLILHDYSTGTYRSPDASDVTLKALDKYDCSKLRQIIT